MSDEESFVAVDSFRNFIKENPATLQEQAMDPIQQQIQMLVQTAQEQLGPLYGQLQGMLIQMRTLNTPAANAEASRQASQIDLITRQLGKGDINPMEAMPKFGRIAATMGKKLQQLGQGGP